MLGLFFVLRHNRLSTAADPADVEERGRCDGASVSGQVTLHTKFLPLDQRSSSSSLAVVYLENMFDKRKHMYISQRKLN